MANPPAFWPLRTGTYILMAKPDLGTKRVCPSCAARFYDLQKRPIECPKCAFTFEPEMLLKQRRTRVPEPVEKPVVETEDEESEDAEEQELEEEEEAAEEVDEVVADTDEPVLADDEDAEADENASPGMSVDEGDEPEEFEDELEADDDEDEALLEEVEEDEDDVSDIIDTDLEKDEP